VSTAVRSLLSGAVIVLGVGLTGVAIWLRPAPPPPPAETVTHVFEFEEGSVAGIAVVSRHGELEAAHGPGGWSVVRISLAGAAESASSNPTAPPSAAEVDQAVAELVSDVVKLPQIDRFPRADRELRDFGLDRPQVRITLTLESGGKESLEIGELTITSTAVYAREPKTDDVIEIGSLLFNEIDAAMYRLRGLARSPDPGNSAENRSPEERGAS
jgi:hypothetical protein